MVVTNNHSKSGDDENYGRIFVCLYLQMPLILCIETATPVCSICLTNDGKLLAERINRSGNQHAALLTTMISEVMTEASKSLGDLSAVAVSKGPGSYTGLRVGVSTAKGLCYALNIPLIGINTLTALANGYLNLKGDADFIIPMLDARRMEVYCAVYTNKGAQHEPTVAKIIDSQSFQALLDQGKCYFIGSGADKCIPVIQHPHAQFDGARECLALSMISLAEAAFKAGEFEDTAYFEPYYLKDFVSTSATHQQK